MDSTVNFGDPNSVQQLLATPPSKSGTSGSRRRKRLKQEGIYATGTTRKNQKEFRTEVKELRNCGDSFSMQREGITACPRKDKKDVFFLTSGCQPNGDNSV